MSKPWQFTLVWAGGMTHSQAVSWLKCFLPLEELNLSPHGSLAAAPLSSLAVSAAPTTDPLSPGWGCRLWAVSGTLGFSLCVPLLQGRFRP